MPRPVVLLGLLVCFAGGAESRAALPLVEDVNAQEVRSNAEKLLRALATIKPAPPVKAALDGVLKANSGASRDLPVKLQEMLDRYCLIGVTINPESRVKAARGPATAELREGRESVVLIKVHNEAGVTHPLKLTGPQIVSASEDGGRGWLEALVHGGGARLSGQKLEYLILRLTPREAGKREATLKFDVGQGTQDLGFRAEVPVLFTVRPAER